MSLYALLIFDSFFLLTGEEGSLPDGGRAESKNVALFINEVFGDDRLTPGDDPLSRFISGDAFSLIPHGEACGL
jgi:hypothetical protein